MLWALLFVSMTARVWNRSRAVVWSDAEGYYSYNPTWFILGDLSKMPAESVPHLKNERGENLNKYTCGVAILQMPFFLGAVLYNHITQQETTNIFHENYNRSAAVAGYTLGFLGLFLLHRALRRMFSFPVSALTTLSVFAGTNLHYYMTDAPGMSHAYSFLLFAAVLWFLPRVYDKPKDGYMVIFGLLLGMICLIRPTNALIVIFILAYDPRGVTTIVQRLTWWFTHLRYFVIALVTACMVWLPQLWYWYRSTGHFVRYSYTNEGFIYWKQPRIGAVLFDTQNGLFLFSPLVLMMVIGMWIGRKDARAHSGALMSIFCLATYSFASWWAWHFGGAFGHRCYIEFYALFALPLAVWIERVLKSKNLVYQVIFFAFLLFFWYYGVKMSYIYTKLPHPWDGPGWRWNWDGMYDIWSHLWKK
jgi:hypothetical protein